MAGDIPAVTARTSLVLLGAGGSALEVVDLVAALNAAGGRFELLAALDDDPALHGTEIRDVPVVGPLRDAGRFADALFVPTLAGTAERRRAGAIAGTGLPDDRFAILVHPRALVSERAWLSPGSVVLAFAVLGSGCRIGRHAFVQSHVVVHPGARVGEATVLASHVVLGAGAEVGSGCYVGAGATVGPRARVEDGTVVPPGSALAAG